ncbi:MAG TPA: response regulator [Gemmatimonadales bacterium]
MPEQILVVEDDRHMRGLVALALKQAGYRVQTAEDGVEALGLVAGSEFDLIICDVVMPGLDGRGLAEQLAERPAHPPLLFISAVEDRPATLPGAFLKKPFRLEVLVNLVGELIRRRR